MQVFLVYFGPPATHLHKRQEKLLEAGRHVVAFGDLSIDIFLEVQNKTYSYIWYQIDYIVYGFHL